MSGTEKKSKTHGVARPIRTRRDLKSAQAVAKTLAAEATPESSAEKRLQSLIHEMDKFDGEELDVTGTSPINGDDTPLRRWSDDLPDPE